MATTLSEVRQALVSSGRFASVEVPRYWPDPKSPVLVFTMECRQLFPSGSPEDVRERVRVTVARVEVTGRPNPGVEDPAESALLVVDEAIAPADPTLPWRTLINTTIAGTARVLGVAYVQVTDRAGWARMVVNDGPGPFLEFWALWKKGAAPWIMAPMVVQPPARLL